MSSWVSNKLRKAATLHEPSQREIMETAADHIDDLEAVVEQNDAYIIYLEHRIADLEYDLEVTYDNLPEEGV